MMKKMCITVIVMGIVLLLAGMYFSVMKAGIPYQDPTPEMAEQYARDEWIGRVSFCCGLVASLIGVTGVIITAVLKRRQRH